MELTLGDPGNPNSQSDSSSLVGAEGEALPTRELLALPWSLLDQGPSANVQQYSGDTAEQLQFMSHGQLLGGEGGLDQLCTKTEAISINAIEGDEQLANTTKKKLFTHMDVCTYVYIVLERITQGELLYTSWWWTSKYWVQTRSHTNISVRSSLYICA